MLVTALGFAYSLTQPRRYTAVATVAVRDANQDLTLLGSPGASNQTAGQLADAHAQRVGRLLVAQRVKADLGNQSKLTPEMLQGAISVTVDPASSLVLISAHAPTAAAAAAIANSFARQDVNQSTMEARATFSVAAKAISQKLASLGGTKDQTTRVIYVEQLSRLQSLSSFARPAELSRAASIPSAPSSPRPVRNTLVAALLGLMLAFALARLRHSLDRRLRTSEEIERLLELPLMGRVRGQAMGTAGLVANERGPADEPDLEASRILRQNLNFLSVDRLRSIVVTSALPQEGKSTVAVSLALANAAAGKHTLLIECDLRRPVFAARLGLAATPGLTDYLFDQVALTEVLQHLSAVPSAGSNGSMPYLPPRASESTTEHRGVSAGPGEPDDSGVLTCIAAGTAAPRPAELLASAKFASFLAAMIERYDLVILDSSPLLPVADTLELVPQVSGVLICVRAAQTTRDQATSALAVLRRMPERPTGLVVTGVTPRTENSYDYYGTYSGTSSA